jgi:hypothetical protein
MSGGATASGSGGAGGGAEDLPLPEGSRIYRHVLNLVNADLAALLDAYLLDAADDLAPAANAFYEIFRDDYDFLFFVTDHDVPDSTISASYRVLRRPAIVGTGINAPVEDAVEYGSPARLKGVIAAQGGGDGMPPFAHEVLHHWGNDLDTNFGFGRDLDYDYGAHWGQTSVYGQLGGFDAASMRCETPADAVPPNCEPLETGRFRYVFSAFGPNTNSFKGVDYAPLELYLMGLAPASEVPATFQLLEEASFDFDSFDMDNDRAVVEASGISEIAFADIVALHGERASTPEEERHFRAAFVLLTAAPASEERLDALATWSGIFGALMPEQSGWRSFESTALGRATLDASLGERRKVGEVNPDPDPDPGAPCDVYAQDCGTGLACFDLLEPLCAVPGGVADGQPCQTVNACTEGSGCQAALSGSEFLCTPYCDPFDSASPVACETLCPGSGLVVTSEELIEVGAYCAPGSGGYCDPLGDDCQPGSGCYGFEAPTCQLAGTTPLGDPCLSLFQEVCVPGTVCTSASGSTMETCLPYCDPAPEASGPDACATLCPGNFTTYGTHAVCNPAS